MKYSSNILYTMIYHEVSYIQRLISVNMTTYSVILSSTYSSVLNSNSVFAINGSFIIIPYITTTRVAITVADISTFNGSDLIFVPDNP